MARTRYKQRRGISAVVGAVFMILVMVGALNLTLWTLQQQDRVTQTVIEKTNQNLNKLNENIQISDLRVSGGKLNLTAANDGGAAATVKSLYIVNETASPRERYTYDLDLTVDGRNSVQNIGQYTPTVILEDNNEYTVKIVTESGNAATSKITPLSSVGLPMSLYVIPPTVSPGNNITLLYTVTNNITDSSLGWEITPTLDADCVGCTLTEMLAPLGSVTLGKGNTALFKWTYRVTSPDDLEHTMTFNATLVDAKPGNYVREYGLAKLVDAAQISYQSEIIIANELVQKPEIFLIIPGPDGDVSANSEQALWGVVVVNPTNNTMTVSRVVLNTYTSLATAGQSMIASAPSDCGSNQLTQIYPTSGWTCRHDNLIEWKNAASPVSISGYSVETFMIRYKPGDLTTDEPSFMISVGVFSSLGQFTKTGLSSSMRDADLSVINAYLTDTSSTTDAYNDAHMFGDMLGFANDTTVRLNVTVVDLDSDSNTHVDSGAKLIVNVPRGFSEVDVDEANTNGFTEGANEPDIIAYGDGTIQIIATMDSDLGDQASPEAKVLSFTAKTPIVNGTKVYIMHTLLDGEADGSGTIDWPAGPVAQIALQVCEDLAQYCG